MCSAPVDGEVQPHQLGELGLAVAQHVGEVVGPVQVGVDGADAAAFAVQVAVDLGGDARQLGDQVHGVLIDKLETGHSARTHRVSACHPSLQSAAALFTTGGKH